MRKDRFKKVSFVTFLLVLGLFQHSFIDVALGSVINLYESEGIKKDSLSEKWINQSIEQFGYRVPEASNDTLIERALDRADSLAYRWGQAMARDVKGVRFRNASNYSEAIALHKEALAYADLIQDTLLIIRISNNIGVAFRRMDDNEHALEYHLDALKLADAINHPRSISICLNSIGNIHIAMGHYDEAISYFERALKLEKSRSNTLGIAINQNNIGEAFELKGLPLIAINHYEQSLSLNKQLNNDRGIAINYTSLGSAYQKLGKYLEATDLLSKALELNQKLGDDIYTSLTYIKIGELFYLSEDYVSAIRMLKQGNALAEDVKSSFNAVQGYELLRDVYIKQGKYKLAFEAYEDYVRHKDKLLNEENQRNIADLKAIYESERKDSEIQMYKQRSEINELEAERSRMWLLVSSFIFLMFIGMGMLWMRQKRFIDSEKMSVLERKLLRSQMNPHFIFNSLNSIKHFVIKERSADAANYLTVFSKLIRKVLQNSREDKVSLEQELEALKLYIEIERMRFDKKFEVVYDLDDDISYDFVEIPPLIIQPFVENAIWHGLMHKEEAGKLAIRFKKEGSLIHIMVEDDGIGRKKSYELKPASGGTRHDSYGMALTQERIDIYNKKNLSNARIEIEDLYQKAGDSTGTLVHIYLPSDTN